MRSRNTDEQHDVERGRLADELAALKGEVKALRAERDSTAALSKVRDEVASLKREKAGLVEENDRKIRETEHKVGLLKTQQDHEISNARRETKLEVREENLKADKDRFKAEMDFQRVHLQREVDRIESILGQVLERLPKIDARLTGRVGAAPASAEEKKD